MTRRDLPAPVEWLFLGVGLAFAFRYRWILDDALVYWRYIDNLLFLDRGLVFNAGEYVEGFSSPVWALLLISLRSLEIDYWALTLGVAVPAFLLFWFLLVRLNRRMSPDGPVLSFPLAYLACCYGVGCYFTSGIETPLVQLSALVYALFVLRPASLPLQAALALSPLVRHEFALTLLICAAWSWWKQGRPPWRMLVMSAGAVSAWMLFRIRYYADLFPNTFHLKNDVNVDQGLVYLAETVTTYRLDLVLILFAAGAWWLRRNPPDGWNARWAERGVMLLCALSLTAYVVKIGGDPRHYRFLAFPFVLSVAALSGIAEALLSKLGSGLARWLAPAAALAVGGLTALAYPPQLPAHPVDRDVKAEITNLINDAAFHRRHPGLKYEAARADEDRERRQRYEELRGNPGEEYQVCTLVYPAWVDMENPYVNRFGLTDAILARTDATAERAAHKFDLRRRGRELAMLLNEAERVDAGVYRRAVEAGTAPEWIVEGLPSIEIVARKIYNRHRFFENLGLALTFPEPIRIPKKERRPGPQPAGSK